ncbi:cysteine n-palmitoyltransferase porcupine [Plakobranchus ocellatus]|uniref:Protein-serine O-palmitoleoyltransferase porcupine n=1 Tax=Plakobranchus ocellatus TaxID=259542 RepID=A0AAV4B922_9GAST|nr:cysteine n-palmitoyltransferase porcupine [Plakobranchus ocellatus]
MEDDFYYDDVGADDYGQDYDDISYEDLLEYINNYEGEVTPEMLEILESYRKRSQQKVVDVSRIAIQELINNCLTPTCVQAAQHLLPLFIMCVVFKLLCYICKVGTKDSRVPPILVHLTSAVFGIMVLRSFFNMALLYLVVCCSLSYFMLCFVCAWNRKFCGLAAAALIVIFSISCELFIVEPKTWHKIRGSQIILSMKIISLGIDIGSGEIPDVPNVFEYMGYCFNVGSVIFGPWISYTQYYKLLDSQNDTSSLFWCAQILLTSSLGVVCLVYSNCLTHWLILDNAQQWILAYRDAQSFRFSHYFVSFISDATSSLSGLTSDSTSPAIWNVARPQHIEIPRSLVEVVTNWNLPMHNWLKTYVFKAVRPYGVFLAVFMTYVASSLLHGLNFQLSAVLLSLGFYSYTEFVFRRRLSQIYDACIQAKKCKPKCDHKYTSSHPAVIVTNLGFGALAMFHLAYLGLMFDSSDGEDKGYTMWHTLDKWAGLNYLSHWVAVGTFIVYWVV